MADTAHGPDAGVQPLTGHETSAPGGDKPLERPDFTDAIDGLDNEAELEGLLFGAGPNPSTAPTGSEETPTRSAAAAPEPPPENEPAGETPPVQTQQQDTPAAQHDPPKAPERIWLKSLSPDDRELNARAVEMVRNKEAANLAEAFATLAGGTPKQADATPAAEGSEPEPQPVATPQVDPEVTRIQSELTELRTQRLKAATDYDKETEINLTSQIEDKIAELQEARIEARNRTQREAQYADQHRASIAAVKATYPESENPDSAFSQAMVDAIDLASYRRDPVLDDPRHLEIIAARVAKTLGAAPAAPAPSTPPPNRPAVPIGMGAPGQAARTPVSRDEVARQIDEADPETLASALWGGTA